MGKVLLFWFEFFKLLEKIYYGIYRVLFIVEELENEDVIVEVIKKRQFVFIFMFKFLKDVQFVLVSYNGQYIFMCMIGGGYFVVMVVLLVLKKSKYGIIGFLNREVVVLVYKMFYCYIICCKQGGFQLVNDNVKGMVYFVGLFFCCYNEQVLVEDV